MRLSITGLAEIRARLAQVRPEEIMSAALAEQAERMAQAIRESLSEPQGGGDHDKPWARTGALRDSIAVTTSGLEAAIGSNDPAAAPQEIGTSRLPPRPFLAPAAATMGEQVAQAIGERLASSLRGSATAEAQSDQPAIASSASTDAAASPPLTGRAGALYLGSSRRAPTSENPTTVQKPTDRKER